jgi:outer membrane lipoprotein-sorting protein
VFSALLLIPSAVLTFQPRFVLARRSSDLAASALIVLAAIGFMLYSQLAWSAPADAADLMERSAAVTRFSSSTANAQFVLRNQAGTLRERRATLATKLQDNNRDTMRLVRFDVPADIKGTSTLLVERSGKEDDMWVYLPAMKKVRRLAASNKRDSFAGTDFSYGDVLGFKTAEWTHTLLGEKPLDGVPHWVVESVPVSDTVKNDTGYAKRTTWLRKDTLATSLVEALDVGGQPFKRFVFSDQQPMNAAASQWQPMKAVGSNLQSGHTTTITFSDFKVGAKLSDDLFSAGSLAAP